MVALVTVSACQPTGRVEQLVSDFDSAAGNGDIVVDGWADDVDAVGPIPVRVTLDGERVTETDATDLFLTQAAQPGAIMNRSGPRRFSVRLADVGPGEHEVCVQVLNTGLEDDDADLGCQSVVVGQLQSDLFDARGRWAVADLDTYTLRYSRQCFCTPESLGPFEVTVLDGEVVEVTSGFDDVPSSAAMGAEDLFDLVQEAIDRPAAVLRVSYDDRTGVPRSIYIDWNRLTADEETSLEIDPVIAKTPAQPPVTTTTLTVVADTAEQFGL